MRARFVGRVSPPERYGHLGQYARQVDVLQLLEMTHTDRCGMDLPDLALASMRLRRMDEAPSGCSSGVDGRAALELCIVNQGRTASSAAWIELHDEGGGVASVRVCGLAPGEAQCLAPVALPPVVTRVQIDTDDEVAERFEENNWVPLALPTLARPRPCTPLPPGRPSPQPPPTATLPPCVTPTATPTRDPRVTDAPEPTPKGIYLPVGQARQP